MSTRRALTLLAKIGDLPGASLPDGYSVRNCSEDDTHELGRLYFDSYPRGHAASSEDEAIDDVRASFRDEYGELWIEACLAATHDDRIVAAVLTVRRGPWGDVPDCPFVIEVFTSPDHRRQGLSRHLLTEVMATVREAGENCISLRVLSDNHPALALYESLGFRQWEPPGAE